MSGWNERIKDALRSAQVQKGVAQVFVGVMRDHIDENYGRGAHGGREAHKPLKPLFGREWKRKAKLGQEVVFTRQRGKRKKRTEYLIAVPSYRNGGQPLRDTGKMYRAMNALSDATQDGLRVTLRGPMHALYQDRGFSTKGPNFIPLTKKGTRHKKGNKPASEGLKSGRDYFVTGSKKRPRGVTVPARPFLLPTRDDMGMIGRSIFLGLRSALKGT